MTISAAAVKKLREQTGVGMMEAKKALTDAHGDVSKAVALLRQAGQKLVAKKQDRVAGEGVVGFYVHPDQRVAALVVLKCETDFVARTEEFKTLAHDLAMQVAAAAPEYANTVDVPAAVVAKEKEIIAGQLADEAKSKAVAERIVAGKLEKFYSEVCLLKQPFIRDESITIEQRIQQAVARLGENIRVGEFARLTV